MAAYKSVAWRPSGVAASQSSAACCDRPRSFSISAAAKPGLYALSAGLCGPTPGTGQYVFTDQQDPDDVETTSNRADWERPSFSASAKASQAPIIDTPSSMLLQILAA